MSISSSFSWRGFAGHGLVEVVEGFFDFVGVVCTDVLVVGVVQELQHCAGLVPEVCLLGSFLCLQRRSVWLPVFAA